MIRWFRLNFTKMILFYDCTYRLHLSKNPILPQGWKNRFNLYHTNLVMKSSWNIEFDFHKNEIFDSITINWTSSWQQL